MNTNETFRNDTYPNDTTGQQEFSGRYVCRKGLIIPLLVSDGSTLSTVLLALFYIVLLMYILYGINFIIDRIVAATEIMASQTKVTSVKLQDGTRKMVKSPIWNPVVAALSFGVFGTISPEVLLNVIDTTNEDGSSLGVSVVLGSATFRLFIITAVCLALTPESSGKPIHHRPFYYTTAGFALFATFWAFLLLSIISPNVIEIWEALATLLMFPLVVLIALISTKRLPNRLAATFSKVIPAPATSPEVNKTPEASLENGENGTAKEKQSSQINSDTVNSHGISVIDLIDDKHKTPAFYRLKKNNLLKEEYSHSKTLQKILNRQANADSIAHRVGFLSSEHTCLESCGNTKIKVKRYGKGIDELGLTVKYSTRSASAIAKFNYEEITEGLLTFRPGQVEGEISINILDDGVYEGCPKYFYAKLLEAKQHPAKGNNAINIFSSAAKGAAVKFVDIQNDLMKISILDCDHCGMFEFEKGEIAIPDNIGTAKIPVIRGIGSKGCVHLDYRIQQGSAKMNDDYLVDSREGILVFEDGQTKADITVQIVDKDRQGKVHTFSLELLKPRKTTRDLKSTVGLPRLGAIHTVNIGICEDYEMKMAVEKLMKGDDIVNLIITSSSWKDQLKDVFKLPVMSDDVKDCRHYIVTAISYCDYAITLPWRLILACVPPLRFLHGWVSYILFLSLLGIAVSMVSDCTHYFSCTVEIPVIVLALTVIPFGLCFSELVVSRQAAQNETTSDAAIGGIFASNAILVFLGLGFSWTIQAFNRTSHNQSLLIPGNNLSFSLILFTILTAASIIILLLRRLEPVQGELGGPRKIRIASALFFLLLWAIFTVLSIFKAIRLEDSFGNFY